MVYCEDCDAACEWEFVSMEQTSDETIDKKLKCLVCGRIVSEVYLYSETLDEDGAFFSS